MIRKKYELMREAPGQMRVSLGKFRTKRSTRKAMKADIAQSMMFYQRSDYTLVKEKKHDRKERAARDRDTARSKPLKAV